MLLSLGRRASHHVSLARVPPLAGGGLRGGRSHQYAGGAPGRQRRRRRHMRADQLDRARPVRATGHAARWADRRHLSTAVHQRCLAQQRIAGHLPLRGELPGDHARRQAASRVALAGRRRAPGADGADTTKWRLRAGRRAPLGGAGHLAALAALAARHAGGGAARCGLSCSGGSLDGAQLRGDTGRLRPAFHGRGHRHRRRIHRSSVQRPQHVERLVQSLAQSYLERK